MRRVLTGALGYPGCAIYIVMALFIDVVLLLYKPQYTCGWSLFCLHSVYFLWSAPRQTMAACGIIQALDEGELKANVESAGKKDQCTCSE